VEDVSSAPLFDFLEHCFCGEPFEAFQILGLVPYRAIACFHLLIRQNDSKADGVGSIVSLSFRDFQVPEQKPSSVFWDSIDLVEDL